MRRPSAPSPIAWLAVATLFAGPTPPGAIPQSPDPLFASDALLELTFQADLKTLFKDRDSTKAQWHAATLTYRDASGAPVALAIKAKTRGHWRLKPSQCDFPPLRLDFPKEQPGSSPFAGQDKLKLTTPCRGKSAEYEQYVLREFLVYKIYNYLTPLSFRARLARITYADSAGRSDTLTRYSFFVEDQRKMAERNGGGILETQGARFADLDFDQVGLVSAFEYLIGGTDWSVYGLHNIRLVKSNQGDKIVPVPYDFDWTGIVWTRYSFPDSRLPIKTVRQRLYRGQCRTPEQWAPVLARFNEQKDAIYALYDRLPDLDPKYGKQTKQYLDDFYRIIDEPKAVRREFIAACREAA